MIKTMAQFFNVTEKQMKMVLVVSPFATIIALIGFEIIGYLW